MSEEAKEKKPKVPRRHRRFGVWTPLSILVLVGLVVFGLVSVAGRTLTAPDWLTAQVESRVNAGLPTGRIGLNRITLQVDEAGVPRVFLRDVSLFDDRGAEIARLNQVRARFSLAALARGQVQPETLRLSGAQLTFLRLQDGQFDFSLGTGTGAVGTLPGLLDSMDAAFATGPLANISTMQADDLTISIADARSGRIWQITDGKLLITPDPSNLDMSVSFEVFNGTENLAKTTLSIITDRSSSASSIGANFQNADAADIALQSPILSFLQVLNAPISGALRADFDTAGNLGSLAGTLEIGAGALQPSAETAPVRFDSGRAYFRFDPAKTKLTFSELSVKTEAASLSLAGHAYLRDFNDRWPSALLGQFSLANLKINSENLQEQTLGFSSGAVDFRLRLNPFTLDVGQLVLAEGSEKLSAKGRVFAGDSGWELATDMAINQIASTRLMSLWPLTFAPNTRQWLADNIDATISDLNTAVRVSPDQKPRVFTEMQYSGTSVNYVSGLPPIKDASGYATLDGNRFSLALEAGTITPPMGGAIDVTGSTIRIANTSANPSRAEIILVGASSSTAVLSLLNEPPFNVLRNSEFGPDLATADATFQADIGFDLGGRVELPDVAYNVRGELRNMTSDVIVPGKSLRAARLSVLATPTAVEISGPMQFGLVPSTMRWVQKMGADHVGKSQITGTAELSQAFVDEFGIGFPNGTVSGRGVAEFAIDLQTDTPPMFTMKSDLANVGLRIPPIGWSKSAGSTGNLVAEGRLGESPVINRLELSAQGLNASGGQVSLGADGQLQTASFARVTAGGWLDAPVVIAGRGKGVTPSVSVQGGSIDVRRTSFGGSGSGAQGGPVSLALDRLVVSEGITLTGFQGDFDTSSGMAGTFTARVNGKTRVSGRLASEAKGTAIRIQSKNAGGVFKDADILTNANGGDMNLILRPTGQNGEYDGTLKVLSTRIIGAPALTEILSAISIVGLLDQLRGPGIAFNEVDASFRLTPRAVTLTQSSAVGPSLGVSLDGIYDLGTSQMDMQGVISPVYFLNGIGQIFSRRGEGLFGFNFRMTGPAASPSVSVNPLSILTPGMFRDIFRKPPPVPSQ